MSKYYVQIASVFALIGATLTVLLTYHHYDLDFQNSLVDVVCGENSKGCSEVNRSDISEVGGLPLAVWGLLLYLFILISLIGYAFSRINFLVQVSFLLAALGVLVDLYLLAVMVISLEAFCQMCSLTYVATVAIAIFLFLHMKQNNINFSLKAKESLEKSVPFVVYFAVASIAVLAVGGMVDLMAKSSVKSGASKTGSPEYHLEQAQKGFYNMYRNTSVAFLDNSNAPQKGSLEGSITITEFADFLCQHCALASQDLKTILHRYPEDVKIAFRHYPLDNTCNHSLSRQIHLGACELAYASQCASEQNRFWDMHDEIFSRQQELAQGVTPTQINQLAQGASLNMSRFNSCMKSDKTKKIIAADIAEATRLNISGTPTIYFNGKLIKQNVAYKFFDEIISIESKNKRGNH
ncbi:MAG: thioredoxin domain-containing protein [Leptospirales bacterium]